MLFSGSPLRFRGWLPAYHSGPCDGTTRHKLNYQKWFTLVDSGRDGLSVLLSCAAIGIVIAAITSTGLGIKLNQKLRHLATRTCLLHIGCFVDRAWYGPTAASYLMVILWPARRLWNSACPNSTHGSLFYHAVLSAITPPVALAIFAAAAIAKEKPVALL